MTIQRTRLLRNSPGLILPPSLLLMKAVLHTLYWEILRKNRPVLGMQLVLLALGVAVAWAVSRGDSDAAWRPRLEGLTVFAFFASILLAFALFSLTENSAGWRMNSMLTRWFVLPLRTWVLVVSPLLAGAVFVVLLIALWTPILDRVAPGLDAVYFTVVLVMGLAAIHALAWAVPRKPGQFWAGAAVLFPVVLLLALIPQDQPGRELFRQRAQLPLGIVTAGLAAFAWYAARKNRCGDWPGELPLDGLWQVIRQGGMTPSRRRDFRSATGALFWSDSLPLLRLLGFSWLVLVLVIYVFVSLDVRRMDSQVAFSLRLLALVGLHVLPLLVLPWLAMWGLFLGCEPAAGFRTRLSAFRATLPLSSGALAAQKLQTLVLGWALLWAPSLVLIAWYDPTLSGTEDPDSRQRLLVSVARWMAASASVGVGLLPVFLWGRFEGFPNLLLTGMFAWATTWLAADNLLGGAEDAAPWRPAAVGIGLALKLGLALLGLGLAWHRGNVTWRFPLALLTVWGLLAAVLIWVLPTWRAGASMDVLAVLLYLPLARPAWCPAAVAANRHRA